MMITLSSSSLCNSHLFTQFKPCHTILFFTTTNHHHHHQTKNKSFNNESVRTLRVSAAKQEDNSDVDPSVPSWAKPGSDEPPPWASNESQNDSSKPIEVPFFVYLLASAITAIAAIGSVFEYVNQKPVFGVLNSDSAFYAPLLGFFAFTGIPTSVFLWFKSVQVANKEAEEQDRRDGYL